MKLERLLARLVLLLILVSYLYVQHGLLSQLKSLPSPIYGGDYYFQLGSINHIYYGGSPLEAPNIPGSEPGYFITYSTLVAFLAKLLDLNPMMAMFLFSHVLLISSVLLLYWFSSKLFGSELIGNFVVLAYLPLTRFPVLKYTDFTYVVIVPLFFFSLLYFLRHQNLPSKLILGIVGGVATLSHGTAFFVVNLTFILLFLYFAIVREVDMKNGKIRLALSSTRIVESIRLLAFPFTICFLISLLYWYKPIFVYGGKTANDMQNWSFPDYANPNYAINYFFATLHRYFLDFSSLASFFLSILALVGIYIALKRYDRFLSRFVIFLLFLAFLASFHYFLSIPLVGTHFSPPRAEDFTFPFASVMLASLTLTTLHESDRRLGLGCTLVLILLLLLANHLSFAEKVEKDRWIKVGKEELPDYLLATKEWIEDNTRVSDVFLSTKELSFALNALTGRKVVISRRSQNSPFLEIEQREAEVAIMLYGNDSSKVRELLKKYNVSYLYWNAYWIKSEYEIENGRISNYFDPFMVKYSDSFRDLFERYGVRYIKLEGWIDPAMRGNEYRKYELLLVVPDYRNYTHPWGATLDKYLKLVWEYSVNNLSVARIYKVIA